MSIHEKVARVSPLRPFWRRQFDASPTTGQTVFDVVCGILLPFFCFLLDPCVFREGLPGFGGPAYPGFAFSAYAFAGLSAAALAVWSAARRPALLLAGPLFAGAAGAFAVGTAMLPFTLVGLLVLIGALGFAPFLTAFAFLRNGVRAARAAASGRRRRTVAVVAMVLGTAWASVPAAALLHVRRTTESALEMVQSESPALRTDGVGVLRRWWWAVDPEEVVDAWERSAHPRRDRIAEAYRAVTGERIEDRASGAVD